jgi:hypothetical protein
MIRSDMRGVDSAVDVYERPGLRVVFDYGMYSSLPQAGDGALNFQTGQLRIGGDPAEFVVYDQAAQPLVGFVRTWVANVPGADYPPTRRLPKVRRDRREQAEHLGVVRSSGGV